MNRAIVPVASMLAIQAMISVCVLALGVMMPAVAKDLAIDPKLVGIFTAIIYVVAAVLALFAAGPIVRLGAVRVCQFALLMAAIGLAFNALALVATTVIAVIFIGAAQGPINPASAHVLAQRVPREWFGIVFSIKQTGVPIGFALAGIIFPFLMGHFGWRGASLVAAAMAVVAILVVELLRSRIDVVVASGRPSAGIWRSVRFVLGHAQLRVLGWSALVFVIAQHTFTFYLVTYLYEHCGLSIARAGLLLALSQLAGTAMRLVSGAVGDRVPRMLVLGWTGLGMTAGCVAIGLIQADTPFWLITLVVIGYGSVVISWNGTSQAEFAHLSPPGETAAVAAVQTSLAFSGAVFGPPLFALIASTVSYRAAFFAVAACVLASAVWQLVAARAPASPPR
ncbi:MFS transporter [Reyranella soli]|jgi:MFS family permease|uniref:Cyanate transporter n=1 Tax=Reyranella soli TaxID=1230389 RepID=A0A512N307_9HYPH|nr:MFS transporter [Reyranella soli]GEP53374.1 cyanate transporter [Reyranella soli]